MTQRQVDERQAYAAMIVFLTEYMERSGPGSALAPLVADVAIEEGWGPGDPASWSDWQTAVGKVLAGEVALEGIPS